MIPKFKKGDKVRIKKDIKIGDVYGRLTIYTKMAELAGEELTVREAKHEDCDLCCTYVLNGSLFWWPEGALELVL